MPLNTQVCEESRKSPRFRGVLAGCKGNKNNFVRKSECLASCLGAEKKVNDSTTILANATICEMPK